jgi:hypothetical protein
VGAEGHAQGRGRSHPGRAAQGAQFRRAGGHLARHRLTPDLYGDAYGRFVSAEVKRWAEVVKASGAKLE